MLTEAGIPGADVLDEHRDRAGPAVRTERQHLRNFPHAVLPGPPRLGPARAGEHDAARCAACGGSRSSGGLRLHRRGAERPLAGDRR
ncbi:hypothetical protein QJS66_16355 [Kocuria rhizophila]|nr:hypothetical protein QJS66_16355 [Kocuria rhizophila]